jgi:hypothetical protein
MHIHTHTHKFMTKRMNTRAGAYRWPFAAATASVGPTSALSAKHAQTPRTANNTSFRVTFASRQNAPKALVKTPTQHMPKKTWAKWAVGARHLYLQNAHVVNRPWLLSSDRIHAKARAPRRTGPRLVAAPVFVTCWMTSCQALAKAWLLLLHASLLWGSVIWSRCMGAGVCFYVWIVCLSAYVCCVSEFTHTFR